MSLERLSKARKKTIGSKQTLKAVDQDKAKLVFVAKNAEKHIIDPILQACSAKSIAVIMVESMQTLGKACGIEVGCASTAILEE